MFKKKTKKQIPKLENVGKVMTVSIVVLLVSSLCLYWFNTAYSTAIPSNTNTQQTKAEDVKKNTASRVTPASK